MLWFAKNNGAALRTQHGVVQFGGSPVGSPESSSMLLQGCAFMACHCGCNFDYNTGQPYENGIGPAHLFAPEWVDDHLAMMAANLAQLEALTAAAAANHH